MRVKEGGVAQIEEMVELVMQAHMERVPFPESYRAVSRI